MAAMASMASEFWAQFGVVMMADVSTAKENVKRVFYVRFLNHPIYLDLIATRPEIRLDKLENDTPEAAAAPDCFRRPRLPGQLGARRVAGTISRQQGSAGTRAESPDRLDRGRGLRHRQREGLHRSWRAGRQPDRRQRRRGRRARSRHDADAVEAGRAGQQRAPQGHDERPQHLHGQRHQQQDHRHRRAWQCRPPHRQTVRDGVRHEGAGLRSLSRRKDHRRAQRDQGRARRIVPALRLRLDQLPARRHHPQHDQHAPVRADAEARLFHHRGARLHHRREGAGRGASRTSRSPAPASTSFRRSRRRWTTRCCSSTT